MKDLVHIYDGLLDFLIYPRSRQRAPKMAEGKLRIHNFSENKTNYLKLTPHHVGIVLRTE